MKSTRQKAPRQTLGPALADLLGQRACTQAQIANRVGMSRAQVSNFLNGHRDVHASTFVEILDTLGIDIMKLIRLESEGKEPRLDALPQQLKLMPGTEVETLVHFLQSYRRRLASEMQTLNEEQGIA